MKELVPQDAKKRIKHIQFGVLSQQEIVGNERAGSDD
jgi:hypothetical protein